MRTAVVGPMEEARAHASSPTASRRRGGYQKAEEEGYKDAASMALRHRLPSMAYGKNFVAAAIGVEIPQERLLRADYIVEK